MRRVRPADPVAHAPYLWATLRGSGHGQIVLLGHVDTLLPTADGPPLRNDGRRWYGIGAYDMKGGLLVACEVMVAMSELRERYASLHLFVTTDEEVRACALPVPEPLRHADAVLCFEGGEESGDLAAVVCSRKGAYTLSVEASGQASHSGAAAHQGRSALEALAALSLDLRQRQSGPVTVTPVMLRAGDRLTQVPDRGTLVFDIRAFSDAAAEAVVVDVPPQIEGVDLYVSLVCRFPAMPQAERSEPLLAAAGQILDAPLAAISRGGASDISYFDAPVLLDGLGPCGGGDHSADEWIDGSQWMAVARRAMILAALSTPTHHR